MNLWAKITIVFLCAAICALSVSLIPRAQQTKPRSIETTPVLLRDSNLARWLLV